MHPPIVRDRIVYLNQQQEIDNPESWLSLFRAGSVQQVYLDATGKDPLTFAQAAVHLRDLLDNIPGLTDPVVVGPVSGPLGKEAYGLLATNNIGITNLPFDAYCEDLKKHGDFAAAVRARQGKDVPNLTVRERVLYLKNLGDIDTPEKWLPFLRSHKVNTVYVETSGVSDAEMVALAKKLRAAVRGIPNVLEPILFHIDNVSDALSEKLGNELVRATPRSFDEHCAWVASVRGKPGDKGSSR